MKSKKSIWTTITGGITSAAPILLSCCKSGACVGVCASPIASLFGISSATLASSPIISALEPLLIAISAVSFTISYYSLYVLPKTNCDAEGNCDCEPTDKEKRRIKLTKIVFWLGLVLSIGFLSYFEYLKYQAASNAATCGTECSSDSEACCEGDSTACENADTSNTESVGTKLSMLSEITCPKCNTKKTETMPTDVCMLSYTCQNCKTVLHPQDGDCCVFCTYGTHKCPSKQ